MELVHHYYWWSWYIIIIGGDSTSLLLVELTELTENNIDCTDVSDKYYNIRLFRAQFHTNLKAEVVNISGRKFITYVDKDQATI